MVGLMVTGGVPTQLLALRMVSGHSGGMSSSVLTWLRRAGIVVAALIAVLTGLAGLAGVAGLVLAMTARPPAGVPMRLVNDTKALASLPDCGTDLASINAGQTAILPVGSDHPAECHVDGPSGTVSCITIPSKIGPDTLIRLSRTHRCR